jgi:hypothetical protein
MSLSKKYLEFGARIIYTNKNTHAKDGPRKRPGTSPNDGPNEMKCQDPLSKRGVGLTGRLLGVMVLQSGVSRTVPSTGAIRGFLACPFPGGPFPAG